MNYDPNSTLRLLFILFMVVVLLIFYTTWICMKRLLVSFDNCTKEMKEANIRSRENQSIILEDYETRNKKDVKFKEEIKMALNGVISNTGELVRLERRKLRLEQTEEQIREYDSLKKALK